MNLALILLLTSAPCWAQIKMPKHAHKVEYAWGWECNHGYVQHRKKCVKVDIPKNGVLTPDGHGWECKPGYEKYRDACSKEKK